MAANRRPASRFFKALLVVIIAALLIFFVPDLLVVATTAGNITAKIKNDQVALDSRQLQQLKAQKPDCILVLGAGVRPDGTPSPMLEDRLETGLYLYKAGVSNKLLLSGDNGQVEYNEVRCMKNYMVQHGVRESNIFLDHAGFSTYESMYRARDIFCVRNAVVVTQSYHEYRALYIGERLGMTVSGVSSDQQRYSGQIMRDLREIFARDKDFFQCISKPKPTYLGEQIPISGSGKASW
ncbi:MAG: SanA/YdcF family protein [Anaerovoracaceae bacterium]|jgi:SanA protein